MIFIDTGAFIARYIKNDQFHDNAVKNWQKLANQFRFVYTSSFVINETITILSRRTSPSFTLDRAHNIYQSEFLKILRSNEEDELQAINIFQKYDNLQLSFTDCLSFVLMEKFKIKKYFGYDRHFQITGFKKWNT